MSLLTQATLNGVGRRSQRRKALAPKVGETFPVADLGCGLTAQLVWITREIADEYLSRRNAEVQRSIKRTHKAALRVDLEAGRWTLNGEPIIFDWNDEMVDGQHRCEIVSESGLPILAVVIRGVDPASYLSIDGGAKRSGADALKRQGHHNCNALAAAANILWRYENGLVTKTAAVSPPTIDDTVARHPDLSQSVDYTAASRRICQSSGVPGFCHYVFSRIDKPLADAFFARLATGEELKRGNPILALRSRLNPTHAERLPNPNDVLPMIIKAWNALREGRKLELIKFAEGEKFPEIV